VSDLLKDLKTAVMGGEKEFTSGSINRAVLLLSVPMVLEMLMESLFAIVDIYFVSKISVEAVATVGITESVLTVLYSLAIGLSTAATATVARRIGEKDPEKAATASVQSIIIASVFSIGLGVAGFIFSEDILILMGADAKVVATGVSYTRIMFAGNIVIMLIFLLNGIFRGAGDASIAMRTLWLSNGINIVLDPCLIFGWGPFPEMGLTGAAIATTIGRGTGVLYQLYHLFNGKNIVRLSMSKFKVHFDIIIGLLKISVGGIFQFAIASLSWIFIMRIMAGFGSQALAGYTIAIRIIIFCILPAWGISNAAATLVGQNLGANEPERAEKSVWVATKFATLFLLLLGLVFFVFADQSISFFNTNLEVIAIGSSGLKVFCIGYIFFASGMVITAAFNGAGDTTTPMIFNFICFWLIQIPLAILLSKTWSWGPSGVFWAVTFSETILAFIAIYWFRKGRWKNSTI